MYQQESRQDEDRRRELEREYDELITAPIFSDWDYADISARIDEIRAELASLSGSDYLEEHAAWLDAEFGHWGDDSESERVARTMTTIDHLKHQQREACPEIRSVLQWQIDTLEASIADFGF